MAEINHNGDGLWRRVVPIVLDVELTDNPCRGFYASADATVSFEDGEGNTVTGFPVTGKTPIPIMIKKINDTGTTDGVSFWAGY